MNLLKDGKICMIGYDFDVYHGVKRIQSIRPDRNHVYISVKTDFFEIETLIKKLDGNEEEVKNHLLK